MLSPSHTVKDFNDINSKGTVIYFTSKLKINYYININNNKKVAIGLFI